MSTEPCESLAALVPHAAHATQFNQPRGAKGTSNISRDRRVKAGFGDAVVAERQFTKSPTRPRVRAQEHTPGPCARPARWIAPNGVRKVPTRLRGSTSRSA